VLEIVSLKGECMLQKVFSSPLWHLVIQADRVTHIVLAILFLMSMLCWSIFLHKCIALQIKRAQMKRLFGFLRHVGTPDDLAMIAERCSGTMPGYFLAHGMQYVKGQLDAGRQSGIGKMGVAQWERLQEQLHYTLDEIVYGEEDRLWVLSTCAGAATLLGLFGTVWGLIHSFLSISERQAADIVTVAPGIAEALMTTIAGLLVAIPALIMGNYLMHKVRRMEQQLYALVQTFNRIVQTLFVS
jgi:biopolymer transport protein TolQ